MAEAFEDFALSALAMPHWSEQAAGDDLFAALLHRRSRFAFQVAYSVLRNAPDSEDVVQETFLRIYRSRAWRRMEDEKAFIARIAWRLAVDRAKKNRATTESDCSTVAESPERSAIAADLRIVLKRLIDALPEELRQPLALSTVDELNSQQIANIMAIPEGTVRSRMARARQILRQKAAVVLGRGNEREG